MGQVDPQKLHIVFDENLNDNEALLPRKYTLTHSDATGDLYLTIGREYDKQAISGWYNRLMRDEVLGEWLDEDRLALHIHLHVSGGFTFGPSKWRESIFKQHLPLVLEAICLGDHTFLKKYKACLHAPIRVHFHAKQLIMDHVEVWGTVRDHSSN